MKVDFSPADSILRLSRLNGDVLSLFIWEMRKPPPGPVGLVDWRLAGLISRHILSGWISGKSGERVLVPLRGGLGASKMLLTGLGPAEDFNQKMFVRSLDCAWKYFNDHKYLNIILELPGRSGNVIDAPCAMEWFLSDFLDRRNIVQDITILANGENEKEMQEVYERWNRQQAVKE